MAAAELKVPPAQRQEDINAVYALASWRLAGYQVLGTLDVKATAYDACIQCTGKLDGITFTGVKAQARHTIAVDPKVIPLGSKVYIPALDMVFTAEDTGGSIKGQRIDVYMDTHKQARQFGVQNLSVYVLQKSAPI